MIFLGWTSDQLHSVWLSAVSSGQFEVESAKQGQVYDNWSQDRRGLHLTLSPEVQNGGTHKLYAYLDTTSGKRVLLDTDNQQNGHFTFPGNFTPPTLPTRPLPPIAVLPPESGVTPPIGTLPPQGMMPTRPGGVTPPMGTLPPQGMMPTRPGGVTPPMGTLPPQGMMPTRPGGVTPPMGTLPPQGMMPTRPGGVTPPMGILPPQGMMPTLPGGVTPPVGTLPPQGMMPTRPGGVTPPMGTLPPQGMMPTRPGGVTPPVGTLPPQGMMPTLPGGVTPPVGTLPPQGVMPTRPGVLRPPTGLLPTPVLPMVTHPAGELASERAWNETRLCVMADERAQLPPTLRDRYPDCPSSREAVVVVGQPQPRRWALWGDEVYYDIADHREGSDLSGSTNVFTLGAETRLDQAMSLGFAVSRLDSKASAFEGGMRLAAGGYNLGPYFTYQLSKRWMLDATLMYGWMDNEQGLLFLSGDYGSTSVSGNLGGSAQFEWDAFTLRPRLAISYSHGRSDGYRLQGDYRGLPLQLERGSDSYNQGNLTGTLELSRLYHTRDGVPVMPYGELGLDYGFERPNDGYILTGNLDMARTQPLSGTMRVGLRTLLGGDTTVTASTGYLSLGQGGLNVWEWRLNLSRSF
ncbi:autotransporter outer membrane beta-barrel domain-containing protein [Aeromonas dhakensis]|uniref:autotransporter outer membrane beta-barrel domain-containing protein n=3 Tax=Aeromonas dhakensis TaxID=196024 RepID=UPI001F222A0A|nr:autotransporter domain-containing protein [Aeromonas dhakensis]